MTRLKKFRERPANAAPLAGLCLALTTLPGAALAASQVVNDRQLAAICAQTVCRPEKIIELRAPQDNVVRFKSDPIPYAYDGTLTIYPGETYAVRMRVQGKDLAKPVFEPGSEGKRLPGPIGHREDLEAKALRDAASAPVEGLIYFSFKQQEPLGKQEETGMMLEIVSAFPITVKYDAVMFVATPRGIQPGQTSSCPVFGGAASIERWPQPLTMLALSNFRIVAGGNQACK